MKFFIALKLLVAALLSQAAQAADYTNSIGMEFKLISAGSFYMGSCKLSSVDKQSNKEQKFLGLPGKKINCLYSTDGDATNDEVPQHVVTITQDFHMGVYEVTLGQFKQFILDADRKDLLSNDFMKYNNHNDKAAVAFVSWNDAKKFISWLNNKEGVDLYRLPTEAEWEYVARAGSTTKYFWGNDESQAGIYAWYDKNAYYQAEKFAHVVGGKKPNAWGVYDMCGNVWEWVEDWYSESYYHNSPVSDPAGFNSGRARVYRGGGWRSGVEVLRSENRDSSYRGNRYNSLGFRLVKEL